MSTDKTGRNDPCPCGSGKKFKHCCIGMIGINEGIKDAFRNYLEQNPIATQSELTAFADRLMPAINMSPIDDFKGLSASQMAELLHNPESQSVIEFPLMAKTKPEAPLLTLFMFIAEAIETQELKATAKGNLPRAFCRDIAKRYFSDDDYRKMVRIGEIRSEEEFRELHSARLIAGLAGLIKVRNGHYLFTKEAITLLKENNSSAIFQKLLRAFAYKFLWSFVDNLPELQIIQQSLLFTLYLIKLNGAREVHSDYYTEAFLQAFPIVLREVPDNKYITGEKLISIAYTNRTFFWFLRMSGLCKVEEIGEKYSDNYTIKPLPLFYEMVRFNLPV